MRRTELLQETRLMRFEEAYDGWQDKRLTQEQSAQAAMAYGFASAQIRTGTPVVSKTASGGLRRAVSLVIVASV